MLKKKSIQCKIIDMNTREKSFCSYQVLIESLINYKKTKEGIHEKQ